MYRSLAGVLLGAALLLTAAASGAQPGAVPAPHRQVYVAIVIDDMGYRREEGLRALELPGEVSFAVLPHTPYGPSIARLAAELGKDVLVHLPMESVEGHHLGPGGLTSTMQQAEFRRMVSEAMRAVPHAVGLSNHMGSRLTADRDRMRWLMQTLEAEPRPFFLDSRTSEHTVAAEMAAESGIRHLSRDVFLDNVRDEKLIERQFFRLIGQARSDGSAVAIGHPYPETIAVLGALIPRLAEYGVTLVPVTRLSDPPAGGDQALPTWQASVQGSRLPR